MQTHSDIIENFYRCFQKLESKGMVECYHPDITFCDPVFPELRGAEVGKMWEMLCSRAKGFELSFSDVRGDETTGSVNWEAKYIFSTTGRRVHNRIHAAFKFQDGKIIEHVDNFNFWKWSAMALGPTGLILGWSPFLKNKVRRQAADSLQKFMMK